MLGKLKFLFFYIPVVLLTGCEAGSSGIFENLDGGGQLIYLGIIIALGIVIAVIRFLFKIMKGNKKAKSRTSELPSPPPPPPPTAPVSLEQESPKTDLPGTEQKDKTE